MNSHNGLSEEVIEQLESETSLCCDCDSQISRTDEYYNSDGDEICEECSDNYVCCTECGDTTAQNDSLRFDSDDWCEECYAENVASCVECGEEGHNDDMYWEDDGVYCDGCYDYRENQRNASVDWNVFSNDYVKTNQDFVNPTRDKYASDSFHLIPSKRYMGVEIETNYQEYVDRQDVTYDLRQAIRETRIGDESSSSSNLGRLNVVSDGSVLGENHEHGGEVVLDPRRGDILNKDISTICEQLTNHHNAYVSRRTGLHVHIDCRDYDWYHFLVLSMMVKYIEPHIYTWVPKSRLDGRWCKPLSQSFQDFRYVDDRDSFVEFWYDNGGYDTDKYNDKRYHGFNLHSHFQANQGLEIRYHGGTLNPDKIRHWCVFWSNLVDSCYDIAEDMRKQSGDTMFSQSSMYRSLQDSRISSKMSQMSRKYMNGENSIDIKEYMYNSELLRRYLKLEKKDKPYLLQPMIEHIRHRAEKSVMSIDNMFDIFNTPKDTQEFMRSRMIDIKSGTLHYEDHIEKCFYNKSNVIEFDKKTLSFKYVDNIESQFLLIDDDLLKRVYHSDIWSLRHRQDGFRGLQNYMM